LSGGFRDFLLVAVGDEVNPTLEQKAAKLADDVSTLVRHLEAGRYWQHRSPEVSESLNDLREPERFSRVLKSINWGSLQIGRRGISENELPRFLETEVAVGSSFDVTSCKNSLVAGVTAALVARGRSSIYTFELRKLPTFDQYDLLPALEQQEYIYRNLSDAPLLANAVKHINSFSVNRKNFMMISAITAVFFALLAATLPQTAVFSLLTGFASFASVVSALSFFLRE